MFWSQLFIRFAADGHSVCACATLRSLMAVSAGPPLAATKIMAVSVAKSFEFVSLLVSFVFLALHVDGLKRSRDGWAIYEKK